MRVVEVSEGKMQDEVIHPAMAIQRMPALLNFTFENIS
jgi:hypothetical protein